MSPRRDDISRIDYGHHKVDIKHYVKIFDDGKYKLSRGFSSELQAIEWEERLRQQHLIVRMEKDLKGYTPYSVWVKIGEKNPGTKLRR